MDNALLFLIASVLIKLLASAVFIILLRRWYKKSKSDIPVIIYWILGIFFVIWLIQTAAELILLFIVELFEIGDKYYADFISFTIALYFYVIIGRNHFTKTGKYTT